MGRKLYKVLLSVIFALVFPLFSAKTYALDISQQDLIVSAHSSTLTIHHNGITANDFQITPQLEFNKIGDFITYKLTLRNNDGKKYKIVEVKDDNTNDAVELAYVYPTSLDTADKSLELTIKYAKKSTTPLQTVTVTISLVDEDDASQQIPIVVPGDDDEGEDEMAVPNTDGGASGGSSASGSGSVAPNTGANTSEGYSAVIRNTIIIYGAFAVVVIAVYFVVRHKKKAERSFIRLAKTITAIILALALIPAIVIAATSKNLQFVIEFNGIQFNGPYTMTFDSNGGTPVPTQTVDHNTYAAKPGDPQKPGYTFAKWLDEANQEFNFTTTKITQDYNLTATYALDTYQLTLDLAGGTAGTPASPITYTYEDNDITLTNPTKDGHDFLGWTGEGITTPTLTITIPKNSTGDKSYTANWKIKTYTVTYTADGGTPIPPAETKNYKEKFTKPATDPTKTGYDFGGWLDQNNQPYDFTTEVTADLTLKAKWNLKTYSINYTLPTGVTNPTTNPATYTYETDDITLEAPTKDHYDFTGWTTPTDNTLKPSVTIPKNSTGDKAFIANFTPHKYTITYDLDGGSETTNPTEYTIKTPDFTLAEPTPPSTGKRFKGWTTPTNTTPVKSVTITQGTTGDLTFTAVYQTLFTVIFDSGSEGTIPDSDKTRQVWEDDPIGTLPANPNVTDPLKIFNCWGINNACIDATYTVTGDTTVVAIYKDKKATNVVDDLNGKDVRDANCSQNTYVASLDPDGNRRYIGPCPKNYVYFNCDRDKLGGFVGAYLTEADEDASACELWRIIGTFNVSNGTKTEKRMKIVRATSIGEFNMGSDRYNQTAQWGKNTLSIMLNNSGNGGYLNNSTSYGIKNPDAETGIFKRYYKAQDYIEDALWKIGNPTGKSNDVGKRFAYTPGNTIYDGIKTVSLAYTNGDGSSVLTWQGKVGLPDINDIMYSSDGTNGPGDYTCGRLQLGAFEYNNCGSRVWFAYTRTPTVTGNNGGGTSTSAWMGSSNLRYMYNGPFLDYTTPTTPAVYLKANVTIKDGDGSSATPFILGIDE